NHPTRAAAISIELLILVTSSARFAGAGSRISFEDRVRAEEAIARVYYGHLIGATRPFQEAVTRPVLEKQVREYLEQSRALERKHHARITETMLAAEWDRIGRATHMPERLSEIAAA